MIQKFCLMVNSKCYKDQILMDGNPKGIVVHSTGANNPYLKRYIQPADGYPDYDRILADIGVNKYHNDWNRIDTKSNPNYVCPHAIIGKNDKDEIECYQILPFEFCCYGCGKGDKGSYNTDPAYIQFEICEDDLTNPKYFEQVMDTAIEFCATLVFLYNIPIKNIVSHKEAHKLGYASNHRDIEHWANRYGWTMDLFRDKVRSLSEAGEKNVKELKPEKEKLYKVQVGAYSKRLNAEMMVNKLKYKNIDSFIVECEKE